MFEVKEFHPQSITAVGTYQKDSSVQKALHRYVCKLAVQFRRTGALLEVMLGELNYYWPQELRTMHL